MPDKSQNNCCDFSLNDIHTPIPISNSTSLCHTFSYPESVDDVLKEAEKAGCVISREEAERYFVCRMSADWVDAAGRKIAPSRLGYDLKKWVLNAEKAENAKKPKTDEKKQREVKYEPEW
jgi:hypothetical protein